MGNVASAVERAENTPAKPSLAAVARQEVERATPKFELAMPDGIDPKRFNNLIVGAVMREPKLIKCFGTDQGRASLIAAAIQCASLGLEPNTALREASLVPRRNKQVDEAQLMIEYRGLIKLARRSGELVTLMADVVYERDEFEYALGTDPFIRHKPYEGDDDPGEMTHCYAVAKLVNAGTQFVVVPRRVVYAEHRAKSDSWRHESSRPYSPWTQFEASMWRKTAVRCIEPFLPLAAEFRTAIAADGSTFTVDEEDRVVPVGALAYTDDDVIDIDSTEEAGTDA